MITKIRFDYKSTRSPHENKRNICYKIQRCLLPKQRFFFACEVIVFTWYNHMETTSLFSSWIFLDSSLWARVWISVFSLRWEYGINGSLYLRNIRSFTTLNWPEFISGQHLQEQKEEEMSRINLITPFHSIK